MENFKLLRITHILILFLFNSCDSRTNTTDNQNKSHTEEARSAFDAAWDVLNNQDLSDSLTFNKFKSFFADDFQTIGDEGHPPDNMEWLFPFLRGKVKTHIPNADITVDKVDASEDFAYVLFRYRETFRERATGKITIDVMHSSVMILKKNEEGIWKCVLWKFT